MTPTEAIRRLVALYDSWILVAEADPTSIEGITLRQCADDLEPLIVALTLRTASHREVH